MLYYIMLYSEPKLPPPHREAPDETALHRFLQSISFNLFIAAASSGGRKRPGSMILILLGWAWGLLVAINSYMLDYNLYN